MMGLNRLEVFMEQIRAVVVQSNVAGRLVVQQCPAHRLYNRQIPTKAALLF
jgi:hypothetical protein